MGIGQTWGTTVVVVVVVDDNDNDESDVDALMWVDVCIDEFLWLFLINSSW